MSPSLRRSTTRLLFQSARHEQQHHLHQPSTTITISVNIPSGPGALPLAKHRVTSPLLPDLLYPTHHAQLTSSHISHLCMRFFPMSCHNTSSSPSTILPSSPSILFNLWPFLLTLTSVQNSFQLVPPCSLTQQGATLLSNPARCPLLSNPARCPLLSNPARCPLLSNPARFPPAL